MKGLTSVSILTNSFSPHHLPGLVVNLGYFERQFLSSLPGQLAEQLKNINFALVPGGVGFLFYVSFL